jgi:hypothetical protein
MPHGRYLACIYLPPATILSVPIYDFEVAKRSWQVRAWKYIIHVAERAFVSGAYIPSIRLETMASVHFAIPTEVAKQMLKELKK